MRVKDPSLDAAKKLSDYVCSATEFLAAGETPAYRGRDVRAPERKRRSEPPHPGYSLGGRREGFRGAGRVQRAPTNGVG